MGRELGVVRVSGKRRGFAVVNSFEKWGENEAGERDEFVREYTVCQGRRETFARAKVKRKKILKKYRYQYSVCKAYIYLQMFI